MATLTISADYTILELTGLISEGNTTESTITSAPVEDGFSVTDGIISKPKTLRLEAIAQDFTHSKEGSEGRAEQILVQLRDWQTLGTKVLVETDGPTFIDYVITSIGYTRTNKASSLNLSISLQEVKTVKTIWVAGEKKNTQNRTSDAKPKKSTKVEPTQGNTGTDIKVEQLGNRFQVYW